MSPQDDTRFVEVLNQAYSPPSPNEGEFDARLYAELEVARRSRRPTLLATGLLAAAAVLVLVRPMTTGDTPSPQPTGSEIALQDTADLPIKEFSLYEFEGFDPYDASDLPEDYQRLATLFLD